MYRDFLLIVSGCFFLAFCCPAFAGETDVETKKTPGKLQYRVIYNDDCTHLFGSEEELTPQDVQQMVDDVAFGGVDVLLVNPNSQRVNYPSKVWQTFWDGYKKGDRSFFGDVPEESVEIRQGPEGDKENKASRKSKIAVFKVQPGIIQDGRNELFVRTGKVDTTILGIDVEVR